MLIHIEGIFVDVVREASYKNVLTVRASSAKDLAMFAASTCAEIVEVPDPYYPHIIHIDEYVIPIKLNYPLHSEIEVVERLTPVPACFVYEYAYEEEDGSITGEYGYCYPGELEGTAEYLMSQERQPISEPVFLPMFRFPGELLGAPVHFPAGEFEAKGYEDDEEEESE